MFFRHSLFSPTVLAVVFLGSLSPCLEAQSPRHSFLPMLGEGSQIEASGQQRSHWLIAETPSFRVYSVAGEALPAEIGRHCETLRSQLIAKWSGDSGPPAWSPKCVVVVHPNRESYLESVGSESADTAGSSLVTWRTGKVRARRVDLRGDRIDFRTAALPHELAHLLLADLFPGRCLPRWADEGVAILEDAPSKRDLHLRDLQLGHAEGRLFHVRDLFRMRDYPSRHDWGVFYAQSASVVEYLVGQATPRQFVRFLERATEKDLDGALRECYGIADVEELDRLWRATLVATR